MITKKIFWSVLLAIMAILIFAFWQEDSEKLFVSPDFKKLKADLVLYGVKYRRDIRGKTSQWVVSAKLARFYEKRKEVEFDAVEITFLSKGHESVTVTANTGRYEFSKGDISVFGDVVVRGFKNYILYADQLYYDSESSIIKAPQNAKLIGSGGTCLRGRAMIYYIDKHKLLLSSPEAVIPEEGS